MMRVQLEIRRNVVFDGAFDCVHILARGDAGAIADAEDVCVNRLRGLPPPHVQNHVGGLSPDAGQGLQGRT